MVWFGLGCLVLFTLLLLLLCVGAFRPLFAFQHKIFESLVLGCVDVYMYNFLTHLPTLSFPYIYILLAQVPRVEEGQMGHPL
jgi:hypothetical protein